MQSKRLLSLFFSITALVFSAVSQADTYRLTHNTSNATTWQQGAEKFREILNEKSGGEFAIKIFPNAVLAGGDQMKQAQMVGRGDIDFVVTSAINVTPLIPEMAVFSLPYLFSNYKQVDAAIQGEPGEKMKAIAEKHGIKILAWGENGFRELTNSVKPVETPDDLNGMKIRVAGPMYIDVFDALGANPQQIQWTETFSALQQGVVDGQENPIGSIIVPQRIYEVQDYLTMWHYSYDPIFIGVSKQLWKNWDEKTRTMVQNAASQAMQYQIELSREKTKSGIDTLKKHGMKITTLSEEQLQAFRDATRPVYESWAKKVGEDLVQSFEEAVGKVADQQ
ncbi:DctP family TRAP transporter solute-binding subunit [Chromohalobacter sp. HP20-39]|uniref:DctP family TRAP transporter solute-binding subunit n=1 Tax=Chromohalobacter sp. HP20-39 TaxID=3079306 RepID=UPI00294AD4D3|nr:DctP family TRAP transporter solute-binding subunit [Chromohalobacter sp. HP20-39]MDV6317992.1 DctP family TRAP transporter solute-binding subunit [Chromohalobacter sp. HP20-39]